MTEFILSVFYNQIVIYTSLEDDIPLWTDGDLEKGYFVTPNAVWIDVNEYYGDTVTIEIVSKDYVEANMKSFVCVSINSDNGELVISDLEHDERHLFKVIGEKVYIYLSTQEMSKRIQISISDKLLGSESK